MKDSHFHREIYFTSSFLDDSLSVYDYTWKEKSEKQVW